MKDCNYQEAIICLMRNFIKAELYARGGDKAVNKKNLKTRILDFVQREFESAYKKAVKEYEEERKGGFGKK